MAIEQASPGSSPGIEQERAAIVPGPTVWSVGIDEVRSAMEHSWR